MPQADRDAQMGAAEAESIPLFQHRRFELDPNFALAYGAAGSHLWQRRGKEERQAEVAKKAF